MNPNEILKKHRIILKCEKCKEHTGSLYNVDLYSFYTLCENCFLEFYDSYTKDSFKTIKKLGLDIRCEK